MAQTMTSTTGVPETTDVQYRAGRFYTLDELAELARRGLETYEGGISQSRAAEILNEHHTGTRGKFYQAQISNALATPARQPTLVLLLVETFTDYCPDEKPRYLLKRKG